MMLVEKPATGNYKAAHDACRFLFVCGQADALALEVLAGEGLFNPAPAYDGAAF